MRFIPISLIYYELLESKYHAVDKMTFLSFK